MFMAEGDLGKIIHLHRKPGEGSVPRRPITIDVGEFQAQFDAERIALEQKRNNAATGLLLALLYPEQHNDVSEDLQTLGMTFMEADDEQIAYSLPQETFLLMQTLPRQLSQANPNLQWEQQAEPTEDGKLIQSDILTRTPTQEEMAQARRDALMQMQKESDPIINLERIRQQPGLPQIWVRALIDESGNFEAADLVVLQPRRS